MLAVRCTLQQLAPLLYAYLYTCKANAHPQAWVHLHVREAQASHTIRGDSHCRPCRHPDGLHTPRRSSERPRSGYPTPETPSAPYGPPKVRLMSRSTQGPLVVLPLIRRLFRPPRLDTFHASNKTPQLASCWLEQARLSCKPVCRRDRHQQTIVSKLLN